MTFTTTLNAIREYKPCADGWAKLLKHLDKTKADDTPLSLLTVLESNGFCDTLWCLRAIEGHERDIRLYAVWCARQVHPPMLDNRSIQALDVAEKYAKGEATEEELSAAYVLAVAAANNAAAVANAVSDTWYDVAYVAHADAAHARAVAAVNHANAIAAVADEAVAEVVAAYAYEIYFGYNSVRLKKEARLIKLIKDGRWID